MFLHVTVILSIGVSGRHLPPSQTPLLGRYPQADTPLADTPQQNPPGRHPLGRHPRADTPGQTPLWADTLWTGTPPGKHPLAQCMLGYAQTHTGGLENIIYPHMRTANINFTETD